jgi:hypothetical protein
MRNLAIGNPVVRVAGVLIAGSAAFFLASAAFAASMAGLAPSGGATPAAPSVQPIQYGSETCAQLRRACLYKRELGERGQGNCNRYRAECKGESGYSSSYYRTYKSYGYRPSDSNYWRYRRGYWD